MSLRAGRGVKSVARSVSLLLGRQAGAVRFTGLGDRLTALPRLVPTPAAAAREPEPQLAAGQGGRHPRRVHRRLGGLRGVRHGAVRVRQQAALRRGAGRCAGDVRGPLEGVCTGLAVLNNLVPMAVWVGHKRTDAEWFGSGGT